MEYDFPVSSDDSAVGPMACEIFIRYMSIVKEAYPVLMKAMW